MVINNFGDFWDLEIGLMKNICLLLLLLCSLLLSSCHKSDDSNYLILATNNAFPPFTYIGGEHGKDVVGFDIALANEIANDMGKTLKIQTMNFENILAYVANGKADIAIRGITITEERKKLVDFSTPYYQTTQSIIILKGDEQFKNIKSSEQLGASKTICVERATTGSILAHTIATYSPVIEAKSVEYMLMELFSGHADALLTDRDIARATVSRFQDKLDILSLDFEVEDYGIAVAKGNRELLGSINNTIAKLINSGEYSKLVEEHVTKYLASH